MKKPGRGCLVIVGALIAFSGQTIGPATPTAEAAPRENRSLFPFRLPWQQQAKPQRRPRRAAKPVTPKPAVVRPAKAPAAVAAGPDVPLPRPAPEPKTDVAALPPDAPQAPAAQAPEPESPSAVEQRLEPQTDHAAPSPDPAQAAPESPPPEGDAASAGRAADFAALRPGPTPEPPPLAPLPSEPEPVLPKGRIAYGVPLPPMKAALQEPAKAAEPASPPAAPTEPQVAMMPRAPLNGPPLPGPPDADTPPPVVAPAPSARDSDPDCKALKAENIAIAAPLPPLLGPASCGAPLPVELTGVRLKDGSTVEIKPAAILRCAMARTVATYVREDLAPAAEKAGPALTRVQTAASYICRGRNNRANAKMSEHGLANALDISGFEFKGGKDLGVYSKDLPQAFSVVVKTAACDRFNTVLGPGSDGFHEDHLHVDLRKRKSARSKLCRWTSS